MNLSISENLLYSTLRIECFDSNNLCSTGTGYLFKFKQDAKNNSYIPVLITNKHVIKNSVIGRLTFTKSSTLGKPLDNEHQLVEFKDFENNWIMHPDENVDLCVLPMAPIFSQLKENKIDIFKIEFDMSLIPSEEELNNLTPLEEIIMIGYPNGIWDSFNNKPILRKGITATHPKFDYNGNKEFVIDAACFPGSSGSPVFLFNENGYTDKLGNTYLGASRIYLLGTLYAGPQHTAQGQIITVPTTQRPIALSNIPNNLGYVIKSHRIKELEELF